jgi:hypothetical protein
MTRMKAAPAVKEGDGERERELAKAALSVAELDALLHPAMQDEEDQRDERQAIPLEQLAFVKLYAPQVDTARDAIIQEMESMVINGLSDLNQPLLSSSLQTAHNLRLLPDLVSNLLADLNDAVTLRITRALDSAAIGREVNGKGERHSIVCFHAWSTDMQMAEQTSTPPEAAIAQNPPLPPLLNGRQRCGTGSRGSWRTLRPAASR